MEVTLARLERTVGDLLRGAGLPEEDADWVKEVYIRATCHGVGHHDIHSLPGRLSQLASGKVNPRPSVGLLHRYGAMESCDGDNGLGEYCSMFAMKHAMKLADEHGIGLCAIRNSNHFLAGAPYVEMAAEEGYLAYIGTRAAPTMGAPGRAEKVIGANPVAYAVPAGKGNSPILFDACLAYASFGELDQRAREGRDIPPYWGLDADGKASTDPKAVAGGTRFPIGGHKGFAFSILAEILTGILSEGQVIDEPQPGTGEIGKPSQTAVCIRADGLMDRGRFEERVSELVERMRARAKDLRIPGQRSGENRAGVLVRGAVGLEDKFVGELNRWAERLGAAPLG